MIFTAFVITKIAPEIQGISKSEVTEWQWMVKPINAGRHDLYLTLSVLLSVDGVPTHRAIRVFTKVIEVKVTWSQQVGLFFEKNWQWLWTAILVPIAGWYWKKGKGNKAKPRCRRSRQK
jgi:hypothetical protein